MADCAIGNVYLCDLYFLHDKRLTFDGPLNHFMKHMNPTVMILRELLYCRGTHSPISIGKQLWSISTVEVRTPGVSGPPSVYFGHIELSLTFAPCIGFGGGRLEMGLLRNLDRNLKQLDNVQ